VVSDGIRAPINDAGAAFRSIAEHYGAVEITEIRRQREDQARWRIGGRSLRAATAPAKELLTGVRRYLLGLSRAA
jgi:hypothetical protein